MPATLIVSATAAVTTVATVVLASLPEAQLILSPLTEGGSEFATTVAGLIIALPLLAVMTLVAAANQD